MVSKLASLYVGESTPLGFRMRPAHGIPQGPMGLRKRYVSKLRVPMVSQKKKYRHVPILKWWSIYLYVIFYKGVLFFWHIGKHSHMGHISIYLNWILNVRVCRQGLAMIQEIQGFRSVSTWQFSDFVEFQFNTWRDFLQGETNHDTEKSLLRN